MVILPLCDLYDYESEVRIISELAPASEMEVIEEGIEDSCRDISEQTYATVHGVEGNGVTELELNEIMTN